jgi:hypothetical protein
VPGPRNETNRDKDKAPKTKPVPLDAVPDYTEWVKKQRVPTPIERIESLRPALCFRILLSGNGSENELEIIR